MVDSWKAVDFLLDLKKEEFFSNIDWENLSSAPAPFIPVPDNDSDTFYFEGLWFKFDKRRALPILID